MLKPRIGKIQNQKYGKMQSNEKVQKQENTIKKNLFKNKTLKKKK